MGETPARFYVAAPDTNVALTTDPAMPMASCTLADIPEDHPDVFYVHSGNARIPSALATQEDADAAFSYIVSLLLQPHPCETIDNQLAMLGMIFSEFIAGWAQEKSDETIKEIAQKLEKRDPSCSGFRLTIQDEIYRDLRVILHRRKDRKKLNDFLRADPSRRPSDYCHVCDGVCDRGPLHQENKLKSGEKYRSQWPDLHEMSRDMLLVEAARLRCRLPWNIVFPTMPKEFDDATQPLQRQGWMIRTCSGDLLWSATRPDQNRILFYHGDRPALSWNVRFRPHDSVDLSLDDALELLCLPEGSSLPAHQICPDDD
jgi:hypothetical protein